MIVEFTLINWVAILIIYLALQNLCKTKLLIMGKPGFAGDRWLHIVNEFGRYGFFSKN